MKSKSITSMRLLAILFVTFISTAGVASATQWTQSFTSPSWDTEYTLNLTNLVPSYVFGVDSLTSAFLSLNYSNSAKNNTGTASFESYVNENLTGTVDFTKSSENVLLALPAATLTDLSNNGIIDFYFNKTGEHKYTLLNASFIMNGTHVDQSPAHLYSRLFPKRNNFASYFRLRSGGVSSIK